MCIHIIYMYKDNKTTASYSTKQCKDENILFEKIWMGLIYVVHTNKKISFYELCIMYSPIFIIKPFSSNLRYLPVLIKYFFLRDSYLKKKYCYPCYYLI